MLKSKLFAIVVAVVWVVLTALIPSHANQEQATQELLDVEVTVNGGKTIRVPVSTDMDTHLSFALVPVSNNSAIRVTPMFNGGKIEINAHLLSEGLAEAKTCDEKFSLRGESLGTYLASPNQTTSLDRDSLSVKFKVVKSLADPRRNARTLPAQNKGHAFNVSTSSAVAVLGCRCGSCDEGDVITSCCPQEDQCIDCSSCGTVCCIKKPKPPLQPPHPGI